MKRSLTIALFILLPAALYSQEQKSVPQLAEEAYAREEYAVAGALYGRMARSKKDKLPVEQWMKLARSYQEIGYLKEAAGYYQHIISRPDCPPAAYFGYGEVLRQQEQYEAARQQYSRFTSTNADSLQLKAVALQSCDSAIAWAAHPARVQLKPLKELNTPGSDLVNGTVEKGLLLMSNGYLDAGPAADRRTEEPYYKAYVYRQYTQGNGNMYLQELLPSLLGEYRYHIGPVCLSRNEDTLYATVNMQGKDIPGDRKGPVNGIRRLQLFQSIKKDGQWSPLAPMEGLNMEGYASSHAVLNSSGDVLYFISNRPGGQGQMDIWYCEKQADGNWGTPVNCGNRINTPADETFPTVNGDGILYFSSKGHTGMGGYDIYRAKGAKRNWEDPQNMKAPINSGADEIGLVLNRNGYEGYLASNKPGGQGRDDIYYFTDPDYFNRLNGDNNNAGNRPGAGADGPVTGPGRGQQPPAVVERKLTAEEEKDLRELERLQFHYDYNSAALLTDSRQLLDRVAAVLKRHPDWKLLILSFADSRGSSQYNIDLSALRCYAVIDYLAGKGIDPGRLYYNNMGEQDPVNGCLDGVPCSEPEYRQNRRSELKVRW